LPVMRKLVQVAVIVVTIVTLTLVAAVGVSAGANKLGTPHATTSSILTGHTDLGFLKEAADSLNNGLDKLKGFGKDKDKEVGQCKPPKKTHEDGTPGHKNHPCGDKDGDTD
jgi:hypothetical protein